MISEGAFSRKAVEGMYNTSSSENPEFYYFKQLNESSQSFFKYSFHVRELCFV